MSATNWELTRLSGSLGAEIRGVDLAAPTEQDVAAIKALLLVHKVVFFPGQEN